MIERLIPSKYLHTVVRHGDTLHVAGMTATDRDSDIRSQTRQVIHKIFERLEAVGSSRRNLVSATIYMVDLEMKDAMNDVWLEEFGADLPTRATVGVADLGPGVLIEVVSVAAV